MSAPVFLGFAIAAFALIISLPWSYVIWRYLPGLKFIQFPWRFLPFVSLGCGLVVVAASAPQEENKSSWRMLKPVYRAIISFLLTLVVVANIFFTWAIARINESRTTSEEVAKLLDSPNVKKLSFEDTERLQNADDVLFTAYTANQCYFRPNSAELDIYPPASQPGGLTLLSERGRLISQKLENERREFVVEGEAPMRARVETYHYPHWVARLDGREIKIDVEPETGLMLIDLPVGAHSLTVTFEPRNQVETWARRVSLLTWVFFIGWVIWRSTRPRRLPAPTQ